jgi:hypothetical protein
VDHFLFFFLRERGCALAGPVGPGVALPAAARSDGRRASGDDEPLVDAVVFLVVPAFFLAGGLPLVRVPPFPAAFYSARICAMAFWAWTPADSSPP